MKASIRREITRRLRHGSLLAAVFCAGPLLGACVSAIDDTSAFGYGGKHAAEEVKTAETASAGQGAAPTETGSAGNGPAKDGTGSVQAASAGSTGQAGADDKIASKTERLAAATRQAASAKAEKAVAEESRFGRPDDRDKPIATGTAAIAAFAGSTVLASSQTDQTEKRPDRQSDSTLFASLYAQSKAKTPIRNADVGKTRRVILPRQGAPMDAGEGAALPGVRGASSLFEIGQRASADYDADILDEASGEEGSFQTASISGLARLAPNGLMVQRPDVQTSCFQPDLVSIIRAIETRFHAKTVVTSGYRSPSHNVRVRGAKRSMHLQCKAADILVPGADKFQVAAFVRSLPNRGGVGTYCNTSAIHVDTGPQRDWNWACRRNPSNDRAVLLASQKVSRPASDD